jgi:hypothetical protein
MADYLILKTSDGTDAKIQYPTHPDTTTIDDLKHQLDVLHNVKKPPTKFALALQNFDNEGSGVTLNDGDTLVQANVKGGDTLYVKPVKPMKHFDEYCRWTRFRTAQVASFCKKTLTSEQVDMLLFVNEKTLMKIPDNREDGDQSHCKYLAHRLSRGNKLLEQSINTYFYRHARVIERDSASTPGGVKYYIIVNVEAPMNQSSEKDQLKKQIYDTSKTKLYVDNDGGLNNEYECLAWFLKNKQTSNWPSLVFATSFVLGTVLGGIATSKGLKKREEMKEDVVLIQEHKDNPHHKGLQKGYEWFVNRYSGTPYVEQRPISGMKSWFGPKSPKMSPTSLKQNPEQEGNKEHVEGRRDQHELQSRPTFTPQQNQAHSAAAQQRFSPIGPSSITTGNQPSHTESSSAPSSPGPVKYVSPQELQDSLPDGRFNLNASGNWQMSANNAWHPFTITKDKFGRPYGQVSGTSTSYYLPHMHPDMKQWLEPQGVESDDENDDDEDKRTF